MKVPCAFVASKILLLLLLGCDRAASNPSHYDVLMIGNSYTMQNGGVDQILQGLLTEAPNVSGTGQRLANGGMRLSQHAIRWQGSVLDTGSFDYVVLQDQSSTPAYHTTHSSFLQSQDGAIILDERAERIGAEVIFFLTWGRRQSVYALIQENLVTGYTTYAQAVTDGPRKPYIAPVGLAFKKIYDDEVAQGKDPINDSTTVFYGLYSGDNSHVTRRGAYLAGCVFFSTITGQSSVGLADTYGSAHVDAATRNTLQEASDYAVFTDTTITSKGFGYPWQGPTVPGPAPTSPPSPSPSPPPSPAAGSGGDDNEGGSDGDEGGTTLSPTSGPTSGRTNDPTTLSPGGDDNEEGPGGNEEVDNEGGTEPITTNAPTTQTPTRTPSPPPTHFPSRSTPHPTDSPTVNNIRAYTIAIEVGTGDVESMDFICKGLEEYLSHIMEEAYGEDIMTIIICTRGKAQRRLQRLLSGRRLFDYANSIVVTVLTTFEQGTTPPVADDFDDFVEDKIVSEEARAELPKYISDAGGNSTSFQNGLHLWRVNTTNDPLVLDFDVTNGEGGGDVSGQDSVNKIEVSRNETQTGNQNNDNGKQNGTSGAQGTPYFLTLVVSSIIGLIIIV